MGHTGDNPTFIALNFGERKLGAAIGAVLPTEEIQITITFQVSSRHRVAIIAVIIIRKRAHCDVLTRITGAGIAHIRDMRKLWRGCTTDIFPDTGSAIVIWVVVILIIMEKHSIFIAIIIQIHHHQRRVFTGGRNSVKRIGFGHFLESGVSDPDKADGGCDSHGKTATLKFLHEYLLLCIR